MLSLYEFYLLAIQYEPGSPQFREVIGKATALYPDERINRISMAMFSYLSNNMPAALEFLRGLEDDPRAWLYFALFLTNNGELDRAEHYARKALEADIPDAGKYLRLVEQCRMNENIHEV